MAVPNAEAALLPAAMVASSIGLTTSCEAGLTGTVTCTTLFAGALTERLLVLVVVSSCETSPKEVEDARLIGTAVNESGEDAVDLLSDCWRGGPYCANVLGGAALCC